MSNRELKIFEFECDLCHTKLVVQDEDGFLPKGWNRNRVTEFYYIDVCASCLEDEKKQKKK